MTDGERAEDSAGREEIEGAAAEDAAERGVAFAWTGGCWGAAESGNWKDWERTS